MFGTGPETHATLYAIQINPRIGSVMDCLNFLNAKFRASFQLVFSFFSIKYQRNRVGQFGIREIGLPILRKRRWLTSSKRISFRWFREWLIFGLLVETQGLKESGSMGLLSFLEFVAIYGFLLVFFFRFCCCLVVLCLSFCFVLYCPAPCWMFLFNKSRG